MTKTKIPWCDFVWNCSPVGEGCRNCFAHTLHTMRHKAYMAGKKLPAQYAKPFSVVQCLPERLDAPRARRGRVARTSRYRAAGA